MFMDSADLPESGTSPAPVDHNNMVGMDHSQMAEMPGIQSHSMSETDNPLADM